jgi:hypothetical protein
MNNEKDEVLTVHTGHVTTKQLRAMAVGQTIRFQVKSKYQVRSARSQCDNLRRYDEMAFHVVQDAKQLCVTIERLA